MDRRREGYWVSRRKITSAAVLPCLVAGLVLAGSASAHTLTVGKATQAAQRLGQGKVNRDPEFVTVQVKCRALFPHRVRCNLGYDSEATRPTTSFACSESWMALYRAHSEGISYRVEFSPLGHLC